MVKLYILFIILVITGCDKIVDKTSIATGTSYSTVVNDTQPGYCFACGLGFDGKFDCSFKMHLACPCKQQATVQDYITSWTFKSGKTKTFKSQKVLTREGACI